MIAQKFMPLVSFLMRSDYKPIKAVDVAKSMLIESKKASKVIKYIIILK